MWQSQIHRELKKIHAQCGSTPIQTLVLWHMLIGSHAMSALNASTFKRHQDTHSVARPYKCPQICPSAFNLQDKDIVKQHAPPKGSKFTSVKKLCWKEEFECPHEKPLYSEKSFTILYQ